ncbi:hypothetical protein ABZ234_08305 [Nocardiopsis sp. NPDC006198]|uniref:hypothetical protein n=1 Tax=Nocardiopsis sp. NPDC006198 TaxID=3154472 RepID=UPI0033BE3EAA
MTPSEHSCYVPLEEQPVPTPPKPTPGPRTTKTTPVPEGLACTRSLLDAAERLHTTDGRASADLADADLLRLLRTAPTAETALDRAVLAVLGAARERSVPWWRIGKAMGVSEAEAHDRFARARERHPDYTAPIAPTLGVHLAHAGDLVDAIADPPQGLTRHAAARLLGAVLLTATLERAPELVAHWLADPALSGAAAAAARHKNNDARRAIADYTRERPGTRADLLNILREAVRATPWALGAGTGAGAGEDHLPAPPGDGPLALPAVPANPSTPLADRLTLMAMIRQGEAHDDDPAHRALRALAEAIDSNAPDLLDDPMREVAALEADERIRLLGPDGADLWDQVHQHWIESATTAAPLADEEARWRA